jgi:hypothetical protein
MGIRRGPGRPASLPLGPNVRYPAFYLYRNPGFVFVDELVHRLDHCALYHPQYLLGVRLVALDEELVV